MTPRRRELLILGGVAAGAAAVGGVVGALLLQSRSGAAELLAATLTDLGGRERRLAEWQGKTLLCNFWATWCPPCREEIPLLNAAWQQYAARGVEVVGIALDSAENVGKFSKTVKILYPVLLAGAAGVELMRSLGNGSGGLPFTVMLDRHGRIAGRKLGAFTAGELERELASLLQ